MSSSVANVGTVSLSLVFANKDINAQLEKIQNTIEDNGKKSGNMFGDAWVVAAGNIIQKGLAKITGAITSNFNTAIKRVDTLNNADKVFTAMGYSADATSKSMGTLTAYLDGLPTSMTTAVSGVQSLAASFDGIEKGTEVFIDMNNAGLAFGVTTDQIENAITQLGQLSLDGPLDAGTWNSLRNSGFGPVFAAMAKDAGVTVGELKESFSGNGTKTVGDFLSALHKLNTEGSGDMKALSELAKANTDGIGTALENVQNRIGRAIAKVIDHIGAEKISGIINEISSHFSDLADVVIGMLDFIADHWDIISPILAIVSQFVGAVVALNVATKTYHKIQGVIVNGLSALRGGFSKVGQAITNVTGMFNKSPVGGAANKVGGIFSKLAETIKSAVKNIGEILKTLVEAITEPLKAALKGIGEALAGFFQALASPAVIMGAVSFAAVAASIAAAIFLIGNAVGAIMPVLTDLFNNIIMPTAQFIASTVLTLIDAVTQAVITLTQGAIIPLGEFLTGSFVTILETVSNTITNLTQGALIPLINTLSGAFVNVATTVGNILMGVVKAALEAVASIVNAVGDGFTKMGVAIKTSLDGVSGVLSAFADLIRAIASAAVAIVALVTGHSIDYGNGYARLDGYAEGGRVTGDGTSTSDSVPAMLSDGEYVINAQAARGIGYNVLDMLNDGDYAGFYSLEADFAADYEQRVITAGGGVTIERQEFNISNELDAQDIGRVIMQSIRRAA